MRIVMIGTGYVGLVSGACLSEFGHDVVCVDNDTGKIDKTKALVRGGKEPGEIDLPAVGGGRDLPSPKAKGPEHANLPAVGGRSAPTKGGFGDFDLPAVAGPGRVERRHGAAAAAA